jgi:hypothetical protein
MVTIGKETTSTTYEKKLYLGRDDTYLNVYLEIEIVHTTLETYDNARPFTRETVDHQVITEYDTLSLSGYAQKTVRSDYAYCGQIQDEIAEHLVHPVINPWKVSQILRVWQAWHLNDMNAACVHQSDIGHEPDFEEWKKKQAIETAKCPQGYVYGSKWLVKPLPSEIIELVKEW